MSKGHKHRKGAGKQGQDAKGHLRGHVLNRKARRLRSAQERGRRSQLEKRGAYVHAFQRS
jgi:hypothetical protein